MTRPGCQADRRGTTLSIKRRNRELRAPATNGNGDASAGSAAEVFEFWDAEHFAEAGIEPSVGSDGDSYDNALAETINGLSKVEFIHPRGSWRSFNAVEYATLEWMIGSIIAASGKPGAVQSSSRSRGEILRTSGKLRHGRVAKINKPPAC